MRIKRALKAHSGIDMTPMIDIVFQLLSFFMITSTIIKTAAINVDLPSAKTSDAQPVRNAQITLFKNGEITFKDDRATNATEYKITMEEVPAKVRELYVSNKDMVVSIQGDKGVDYGSLIEVMDKVRQSGVKKMSLATKRKE